jgi:hypothetical protein
VSCVPVISGDRQSVGFSCTMPARLGSLALVEAQCYRLQGLSPG